MKSEQKMMFKSRWASGFLTITLLVVLDQMSKLWVEMNLPFHQSVSFIPFLSGYRTYNEGIAFSFLSFMDDRWLIVLTGLIIILIVWLWSHTPRSRWLTSLGYAMIIGGAIGNLVDRVLLGHVVDFIQFHTQNWSFAVFNLADSFITIGAGLIIFDEILTLTHGQGSSTGTE